MNKEIRTLYTVSKVKKHVKHENRYLSDDEVDKICHGSDDGNITLCGCELNSDWYIRTNAFDGEINCKKCLDVFKQIPAIPQRVKRDDINQLEEGLLRETYELEKSHFSKDVKSFAKNVRKYINIQRKKGLQFRIGKPEKMKFKI